MNKLKSAIRMSKQRFQYLKMKIFQENEVYRFIEQTKEEENSIEIPHTTLNSIEEFKNWKERHLFFGSKNHDLTQGVIFFHLFNFEQKFEFYMSTNHAGNDARGHFEVLKDILMNLECIISNRTTESAPKSMLNIHLDFKHSFDLKEIKLEPVFENEYQLINYMPGEVKIEDKFKNLSYYFEFFQLNEELTEKILQNCKSKNCTVQALFSLCSTLALIDEKTGLRNLNESVECLNSIPCDMRYYFNLEKSDLVKSAASLCWMQNISTHCDLWSIAKEITEKIGKMRDSNEGIKWWLKCLNNFPLHKYYHVASSIGKVSLDQENLIHIKVTDLRFSCSTPYDSLNKIIFKNTISRFQMMHVITFNKKLTGNFCYSYPTFSSSWDKEIRFNKNKIIVILNSYYFF
ncbi:alcohol acetyltransferase [Brachionus plicatilis]|uniref:Alcohol acetyltransferase n=1 Tax=Brachionus plicatilis TaxID=10195 RepID=A0A3M7RPD3_BRAPC|nr:alcohol acetyltransferase [Brachionus plicatilis]